MMDHQNWYYTLSAIAQTCGAILAIGGAFVVFQMEKIKQAKGNYKGRLRDAWSRHVSIDVSELFDIGDLKLIKEVESNLEEMAKNFNVQSLVSHIVGTEAVRKKTLAWLKRHLKYFKGNIEAFKNVLSFFKWIIILLTIVIVMNLFFLGRVDFVNVLSFRLLLAFSLSSIIISSFLFWRILTEKYIN